ncbi:PREDICTED: cation-dependent mannose-6-phosphate receptor-like [Vollenhovia emeryi]|uniref:cation-dependent mannose-6-phosphate receptor-like n=1 Tax=Vollenhovia emeryi TaxID=411798 RepID=UPI0005F53EDC|nr:PREDICTED: cation-dependent mannose-6-phosphate receptor-like [Vollenhovia emeryi]
MCCYNATFIVLSLFLILFCDPTSSECTQLAPCVCSLPDGYYYNLTGLANAEPFVDDKYNWTVHFHPCTNVKMKIDNKTPSACTNGTGVSLCMYNKTQPNQTLTGTIEETKMTMSSTGNTPVFEIVHKDIKSIIEIVCFTAEENESTFTISKSPSAEPKAVNRFALMSPHGCKIAPEKGLSTGSVLVILFFVCAGLYFIGGIVALKTLRGATGWEMVPNHEFWCKLPSLVRDGVVFTFSCCRADSYERI